MKNGKHVTWDRHLARIEIMNSGANSILIRFEKELNTFIEETYDVVAGNRDLFV